MENKKTCCTETIDSLKRLVKEWVTDIAGTYVVSEEMKGFEFINSDNNTSCEINSNGVIYTLIDGSKARPIIYKINN